MVKCIALWNYRQETTHRAIDEVVFKMLELKKLNEVLELTVSKSNIKGSTKDLALTVTLLNERDLKTFLDHPAHKEVIALTNKELRNFEVFYVEL